MSTSDECMNDPRITVFWAPGPDLPETLVPGWYAEVATDADPRTFGPRRTRLGARRLAANFLASQTVPG